MDDSILWRAGTVAHYIDAEYYDQAYRRRSHDKAYYADCAAGRILELGAGTGRITLAVGDALSRQDGDAHIVGIESMGTMRERAEMRLGKQPKRVQQRVTFADGDFRTLDLGETFDQVIAPFNSLMHLYTAEEFEATLDVVRKHLKPNGLFRFDVLLPDPAALDRDPSRIYKGNKVKLPATGLRYHYGERFSYDAATQVQIIEMLFTGVDDEYDVHIVPLAHRQFFPAELRALLRHGGFEVLTHEGDFDGEPLDANAESQLIVARVRD
ncbi:MAG: SAM-dependent methyltransferase [Polyangiales bacterium]|jgi:SAM-dependent methyltransferase